MKKYWSFFRIRFSAALQYRAAAWAGVATQFAWGMMNLLLYRAFYTAEPSAFPITLEATVSYIWLQQALLLLFMLWHWDKDIFSDITGGGIAYTLIRPMDLYTMWFVKNMAQRLAGVLLRCVPILLVAALLPAPYGLSVPVSGGRFLLFLFSLLLAFFNVVAFSMLVYIATFYTMNPMGIRMIALSVTDLLTGAIIPLPFFPERLRAVIELTPFASMQNMPLLIYTGSVTGGALLRGLLLQLFWLAVMALGGWLWMRKTLRRVVVQGG